MVRRHRDIEEAFESQTTAFMSKPPGKPYLDLIYLFVIVSGDKMVNELKILLSGTLV